MLWIKSIFATAAYIVKIRHESKSGICRATLYQEMKRAGFEDIMPFIPDGTTFWTFLRVMAEEGTCVSCYAGSGNPECEVRICAKEKDVKMCALCECYP